LLQAKVATNGLLLESFIAAVLALLTSFSLGLTGFMVRKWRVVPNPIALIRGYADGDYERTILAVGGEMAKVEQEIRTRNDAKARQIRCSSYFMLAGLVLAFIFVLASVTLG
jgi:hypothetical protein